MPFPTAGQPFGRYQIEHLVAQGGMGAVFRAQDSTLHRAVALKVLKEDSALGPDELGRFLREGRIAAQLAHPNIVVTYDVGAWDGVPFIAMEWVDGVSLSQACARAPLPRRLELLASLAETIAYAHERGVVHRDVKPSNVIVDAGGAGRVRLADFGIARRTAPSPNGPTFATSEGVIVGTPSYMAPEQMISSQVGPSADQFSWGVLAYEMLNGQHPRAVVGPRFPFQGGGPAPWSQELPPGLRDVVLRAMAFDPDARFGDMRALLAAWHAGVSGAAATGFSPTLAPPTSPAYAGPSSPYAYASSPPAGVAHLAPAAPPAVPPAAPHVPHGASQLSAASPTFTVPPAIPVTPAARSNRAGLVIGLSLLAALLLAGAGVGYAAYRGDMGLAKRSSSEEPVASSAPFAVATGDPALAPPSPGAQPPPAANLDDAQPSSPLANAQPANAQPANAQPAKPASPAPSASPAPLAPSASPAPLAPSASPASPAPAEAFDPNAWKISSTGVFKPFTTKGAREIVMTRRSAITACYRRAGPSSPSFAEFFFELAPSGTATLRQGSGFPAHAVFDPCMRAALQALPWGETPKGGKIRIGFSGP